MPLEANEPEFAKATIELGDSIAEQLVESSRRSRPRWIELFAAYSDAEIRELMQLSCSESVTAHPLVGGFLASWAQNTTWGIQQPLYFDGVRLKVPASYAERLAAFSNVESFSLFLSVRAEFCSATMCSDESHGHLRLVLNCPAFLHIASRADYQHGFERTLRGMIQHEMAHIRHRRNGARSEIHAHCRGIASVLDADAPLDSPKRLKLLVETDYPELAHNEEIKAYILNCDRTTWRLIRLWRHLFAIMRNVAPQSPSKPASQSRT